jgi:hypothetical protein
VFFSFIIFTELQIFLDGIKDLQNLQCGEADRGVPQGW